MTTLSPKDVVIVDGVRTAMGKSKKWYVSQCTR